MSNSLLNLLEVLNEVLEEQGLQEQGSGGAPDFAKLKKDIDTFISSSEKAYEEMKNEVLQKKGQSERQIARQLDHIEKYWKKYESERASENIMLKMYAAYMFLFNATSQSPRDSAKTKYFQEVNTFSKNITEHIFLLNTHFLRLQSGNPHETSHQPVDQTYKDFFDVYKKICKTNSSLRTVFYKSGSERVVLKKKSSTGTRALAFFPIVERLLDSLSKGIGAYRVSFKPTDRTFPDQLADKVEILDYLDFRAMRGEMSKPFIQVGSRKTNKTSYFAKILGQIRAVHEDLGETQKSLLLNLVQETFTDIFDIALKDTAKNNEWQHQINFLLESSKGIRQYFPETDEYFHSWAEEFRKKYPDDYAKKRKKLKADVVDSRYQSMIDDIKPNLGKTFTSPRINLSDGSLSNDFLFTVDNFFDSGANDFNSRIKQYKEKMSIFSKNPKEFKEELENITTIDFMNRVLLMDYFVEFSKGFTNTTAGILFEYFLAGLFNGEVVGHYQGVTDFKVGKELYSAKFLAPGTPVRQALSRFEKEPDKTITYILGKKLKSYKAKPHSTRSEDKYTFGVQEIHDVDLYKFDIKFSNGEFYIDGNEEKSNLVKVSGEKKQIDGETEVEDTRVVIMNDVISSRPPFSRITVMSTSEDTIKAYRETVKEKLKGSTDKLIKQKKNILEMVQDIFDSIKEGESSARKYVSDGKKENGVNAIKKLTKSQISMRLLNKASKEYEDLSKPNDT
jgi:hypothetical protein